MPLILLVTKRICQKNSLLRKRFNYRILHLYMRIYDKESKFLQNCATIFLLEFEKQCMVIITSHC